MEEQRQVRCLCDLGCGETVSQEKLVAATCNLTRSLISRHYRNLPAVIQAVCVSWGHVDDMATPTQDKAQ